MRFMKGDNHDKARAWNAVVTQSMSINCRMTSLAMNSGYCFESMQSAGMRHLVKILKREINYCSIAGIQNKVVKIKKVIKINALS